MSLPSKRKTFSAIAAGTALAVIGAVAASPTAPHPVVVVAQASLSLVALQLAQGIVPLRGGGPLQTRISAQDVRAAKTFSHGIAGPSTAPPTTAECRSRDADTS